MVPAVAEAEGQRFLALAPRAPVPRAVTPAHPAVYATGEEP